MSLHDLPAEQAILGACLLGAVAADCAPGLRDEHYYDPVHGRLWQEICQRQRAGQLCDAVTLRGWADREMSGIGGGAYLLQLLDAAAPLNVQIAAYADAVRAAARRRAVVEAARSAIATAQAGTSDALTTLEASLQAIAQQDCDGDDFQPLGEIVTAGIERAAAGQERGLSTGFAKLDAMTGGLRPGLWVLAAATSMGKSIMAAAIARAVAAQGYGVMEHHLEMTRSQVALRTATAMAFRADHRADNPYYLSAMRNQLSPRQWDQLRGAGGVAARLPIWIDTRPARPVSQIEASSRRLLRQWERKGLPPGLIVVDHQGLIASEPGARHPSELERANARAEALLAMQKRLGAPVLVVAQVTKEGRRADGDDRLPTSDDLKYGGALTEAADTVLLLHRRGYYAERKPLHLRSPDDEAALRSRETTIVVDKCRAGQRGQMTVLMDVPTAAVWEEAA